MLFKEQKVENKAVELEDSTASAEDSGDSDDIEGQEQELPMTRAKMLRVAMIASLAIFLHNFPEGLATFLATIADPNVG